MNIYKARLSICLIFLLTLLSFSYHFEIISRSFKIVSALCVLAVYLGGLLFISFKCHEVDLSSTMWLSITSILFSYMMMGLFPNRVSLLIVPIVICIILLLEVIKDYGYNKDLSINILIVLIFLMFVCSAVKLFVVDYPIRSWKGIMIYIYAFSSLAFIVFSVFYLIRFIYVRKRK